jgi:uncharacterized iron-regulated membrane protein
MFVFLDARRMDVQLHAAGFASYAGGPTPGYEGWIYRSASVGFCLLFLGILLAGAVLWIEHLEVKPCAEEEKKHALPGDTNTQARTVE